MKIKKKKLDMPKQAKKLLLTDENFLTEILKKTLSIKVVLKTK